VLEKSHGPAPDSHVLLVPLETLPLTLMSKRQRAAAVSTDDAATIAPPPAPLPPSLLPLSLLQKSPPLTPDTWSSFLLHPHLKRPPVPPPPAVLRRDEYGPFYDLLQHCRLMTCGCPELERTGASAPPPSIFGLDAARAAVEQLVQGVVKHKHSTSMLLVGPRGCGKTSVVNAVLDDLQQQYRREAASSSSSSHANASSFWVVRLHGLALTTDAQAFREIATQLSIEEEVHKQQQLMLQPSDSFTSPVKKSDIGASTSAHLAVLFDVLKKTGQKNDGGPGRAIIFFLEDFDRFAPQGGSASNHQALLYNLLDMTHNSGMRFGVLGTSVRTDVLQMLEKRVRSRFSQLTVVMTSATQQPNHLVPIIYSRLALPTALHSNPLRFLWNERVELLLLNREFWRVIYSVAQRTRDVRALLRFMSVALTHLSEADWLLRLEHFNDAAASMRAHEYSVMRQMQAMTPLQQVLMGALLRLVRREFAVITFAAVMQQFREFVSNNKDCYVAAAKYSDTTCARAVDELVAEGVVDYSESGGCRSRTRQEYRALVMLVQPTDVQQFFLQHREVSPELREWAGRDRTSEV
jgi:origin recognition complex subunit 4